MTLKVSRGLRNQMLVSGSFKGIMEAADNCKLQIYSGTPPNTARDAVPAGAVLLVEITEDDATGLLFDSAASQGVLAKDPNQVWQGTVANTGEAAWYRLVADGDTGNASDTEPRLQGAVGLSGAELNLSDVQLTSGAVQTIDYFVVNFPDS